MWRVCLVVLTVVVGTRSCITQVLAAAAAAAKKGAESTAGLVAAAGRASYVEDSVSVGVADPGATAVAAWLSGAAEALKE